MDVQLPDGTVLKGIPDGTTKAQIVEKLKANGKDVPADWLPKEEEGALSKFVKTEKDVNVGIGETAANLATGAIAGLGGGLVYLGSLATGDAGAAKAMQEATQNALTYQPRSDYGKAGVKAVSTALDYAVEKPSEYLGSKTAEITGSPALGAAVKTGIQAIPLALGPKVLKGAKVESTAAETAAEAASKAKEYVNTRTALSWNDLSEGFKKTLTEVAKSSKQLDKLDPKAVERQARLQKLNLTATHGQVARDLSQLTREEAITKSDAGAPIRNILAEQDRILHEHLDTLRGQTGGTAQTRQQVGQSVQGSELEKLASLKGDYNAAYKTAKEAGAGREPADISPLNEWLKNPTNRRNAGYLRSAIDDYIEKGPDGKPLENGKVKINDLEEIRKEATANTKKPGPEGHFAKEAVKVIDQILDNSGSQVYRDARSKFKAVKDEFDRQGRVAGLVKNKGYTTDRAVALEDTFDNVVLKGSNEQLKTVQESLTKGGTEATRAKGTQAWNDLRAATIDYLKDKAAGKRAIPGEKSQLQFNSTFLDALYDLEKDGKIDTLFGQGTADHIRSIAEATRDVRTKPTGRIAGSDTASRAINFLEKIAALPGGKYVAGAAKTIGKISSLGEETRQVGKAKSSPIDEAAGRSAKDVRKKARSEQAKRIERSVETTAPLTLKDNNQ